MKKTDMKFVMFKKYDDVYLIHKHNDFILLRLGMLFEEQLRFLEPFLEKVKDSKCKELRGNAVTFNSYDDNKIKIMFPYDEDPEEYAFIIDKELLIKIIRAWQKLVKQEPKEITIYQDGNVYTLEGVLGNGEKVTHTIS